MCFFFIFKCRLVAKLLDNLRISLTSGKVIQKFLALLKLLKFLSIICSFEQLLHKKGRR